jgi:Arc/MetJ-type ribon-helix-helix transcriptional regulator
MTEHRVILKLTQQQLELLDRTVARGVAADRVTLVRKALREFAQRHAGETPTVDLGAPR